MKILEPRAKIGVADGVLEIQQHRVEHHFPLSHKGERAGVRGRALRVRKAPNKLKCATRTTLTRLCEPPSPFDGRGESRNA